MKYTKYSDILSSGYCNLSDYIDRPIVFLCQVGVRDKSSTFFFYSLKYEPMVTAEMLRINEAQGVTPNARLGDLQTQPADIRTFVLNHAISLVLENRTVSDEAQIQEEAQRLRSELTMFRSFVRNPNNYPVNARETVAGLYKAADNKDGGQDMETRVSARLAKFSGIHTVLDYDNTVTDNTKPLSNVSGFFGSADYLTALIPGSAFAEPLLKKPSRENFPELYAAIWQFFLNDERGYQIFKDAGRSIPLREGLNNFFKYAKQDGIRVTIASANFEPFVMGGLNRVPEATEVNVFAIKRDSILPTAKGDLLIHLAQKDPQKAIIYVGDGASDLPALQAKELVACYFALEGSEFAKALREEKLPHFIYRDFNDVALKLEQLSERKNRIEA